MLRYIVGDEKFFEMLKTFAQQNVWKSVNTDDFRRRWRRQIYGQDLGYFFIQWIESSGAPEFRLEYTIYRTQKGFRVMGKITQDLDTFRMPVDLQDRDRGQPGDASAWKWWGRRRNFRWIRSASRRTVTIDPNNMVLRYSPQIRVAVAIRKGEQFAQLSEFGEALQAVPEGAGDATATARWRITGSAEVDFLQNMYQQAANDFRECLNGDQDPKWTEVWAHINLGKIFDVTGQRDRAVNEYNQAIRTHDDTQGAQEEAAKYLKTAYQREKRAEP